MKALKLLMFSANRSFTPCISKSICRSYSTSGASSDLIWPIRHQLTQCQVSTVMGMVEDSFDVGYIDTMDVAHKMSKEKLKNVRNVLFLGNEHFSDNMNMLKELQRNFFEPLAKHNCRVVMPFTLGSKHTFMDNRIMYKDELLGERTQFVVDFIANRRLKKVDLIVGHSMGCFMAMALGMAFEGHTKLAFICPLPGNCAPRWIEPAKLSFRMMSLYRKLLFYPLTRAWVWLAGRRMGPELMGSRFTNEEAYHLIKIAHGMNYDMVRSVAISISTMKSPFLYLGCRDDPTVDKAAQKEYLKLIGLSEADFDEYDENYRVQGEKPVPPRKMRGVMLPGRTHFPFRDERSSEVIVQEILKLLDNGSVK